MQIPSEVVRVKPAPQSKSEKKKDMAVTETKKRAKPAKKAPVDEEEIVADKSINIHSGYALQPGNL